MGDAAGLYERISDDREGRELGVARQDEDLVKAATAAGDFIIDKYRDNDISASTRSSKRRPEYERLIEDARAGRIRKIWAYTSNRLTRRPRESEDLIELAEKFGIRIVYLRSPSFDLNTSHGRQIARIMAANDAAESEVISERVQRKKLQIAQQGGHLGGRRPFGFEADGIAIRESEARYIRDFSARVLAKDKLGAMARELNDAGMTTTAGNAWRGETVGLMLKRERNAGLLRYQGAILGEASWDAIVDLDTWRAVVAVLNESSRTAYRGSHSRKYVGANLYRCGVCDDGTTMRSPYRCRKADHMARAAAPIDEYVESLAVARLLRPDTVSLLTPASNQVDTSALHREANAVRRRLDELDDELDDGLIDKARWTRRNARLAARLNEIDQALSAAAATSVLAGLAGNPDLPAVWFGSLPDRSDGLPVGRRAAAIDALMTVTLLPGRTGRPVGWKPGDPYFDEDSVRIDWKVDR